MKQFRLYHLSTAQLQTYEIGESPLYIAISHAWSDQIFSTGIDASFGGTAIRKIVSDRLPTVEHCWIDNYCIKQNDEADKMQQIPLMGDIYSNAEVVAIVLTCEFGFTQEQVDKTTAALTEAVEIWREEEWAAPEFQQHWKYGPGRDVIVRAMHGLAKLTKSSWGTRIWTLQEYILANSVIWIGSDLSPVAIDDVLFMALPDLCDRLPIVECMPVDSQFQVLHTHFSGMASSRLNAIDCTRTIELLGNRSATVPVDEVYGIMACCGVKILPSHEETREQAWKRWWEEAVRQDHVRWIMLPPFTVPYATTSNSTIANCVMPEFVHRYQSSAASGLDTVAPLASAQVSHGTVTLSGRTVGNCTLFRVLGSTHKSKGGVIHRDITLILFARGRWTDALNIVEAFGPGRYSRKQQICLARVLCDNYSKVLQKVRRHRELDFRPRLRSEYHSRVWGDLMQLQVAMMGGLNSGIGCLAWIRNPDLNIVFTTVVIVSDTPPNGQLIALDCNAATGDGRSVLLIAEVPAEYDLDSIDQALPSLHKLGTTIPVASDYREQWDTLPLEQYSLGGSRCRVCDDRSVDGRMITTTKLPISEIHTRAPLYLPVVSSWSSNHSRMIGRVVAGQNYKPRISKRRHFLA